MSVDEFDPEIERLFARTPHMADAPLFVADVEARLASSSRVRTLALTLAGLVGGAVAVNQAMHVNINFASSDAPVAGRALGQGLQAASAGTENAVQSLLDQVGLANVSLGSMSGMQLFWIATAALIALAAAGVMKLSQEA
ncbi:hypothetical protein [Brevundimonas goettingensis]|uniref:Uncharacterized protein n=1 Tax=Brevundimonas goettingensis TaxID=2774190 RepID=A0A975C7G5_9CAUL|nr:hypothetical protein [Brevundimonas goettingensis]QTC92962.1 hypothetical protein IFJ75_09015 [Brevundimonas goettingensis]